MVPLAAISKDVDRWTFVATSKGRGWGGAAAWEHTAAVQVLYLHDHVAIQVS